MKRISKSLVASFVYGTGLWRLLLSRRQVFVLTYHRIRGGESPQGQHPGMFVRTESFRRQLSFLSRVFTLLRPEEFYRRCWEQRQPDQRPGCLLTFDDGWRDNYIFGLPALLEFDAPAIIFLITDLLNGNTVPWDLRLLLYLENLNDHPPAERRILLDRLNGISPLRKSNNQYLSEHSIDVIMEHVKGLPASRRDVFLEEILEDSRNSSSFITLDNANDMASKSRVSFGSHTCSHALLDQVETAEISHQLESSFHFLQEHVSGFYPALAFPNGNHTPGTVEAARHSGYRLAFTTRTGRVESNTDPLMIPRISIHEDVSWNTAMFVARILKLPGF